MNAGAVILTDCVFWFIIVPILAIKDYDLNIVSTLFPTRYMYIYIYCLKTLFSVAVENKYAFH